MAVGLSGLSGLPGPVSAVCHTFLGAVPDGLVTGLHLRGGLAFGEWVPGRSDVDFVAVLAQRPGAAEVEALRVAHVATAAAHPDVFFDGAHVVAGDLERDPDLLPPVPSVLMRRFDPAGPTEPLVAWAELAAGGVTVHGPALPDVWTDQDRLLAHTRSNLDTYWRGWADRLASGPAELVDDETTTWCVLGATRLHHLLVTRRMTAKSRAGRWALEAYDVRWRRVLREALRIREGGRDEYPGDPALRGRDVADLTAHVVAEGTAT
ncbi:aminoglycoside adenylyltransferase domain-containing protein [Nocardioides sp.]|uniref:aminoglycoside adenylyltransferase domain-containing protein n=1 Tax=Nocardioides sp. TaxID=35761 RepID=UPI0027203F6D|nr:aminoglycoside adenylyltransferase domain-containing protein [Nocardioides sp.]MDO9455695.1 DUF4111 domain-containing protein [Nocardioides sp.]